MALPTATPAPLQSPQVVGSAFVHQYYHLLHTSPEIVHKFYQDISTCVRPNSSGEMTQVSTLQAINDSILSFKFNSYIAEIETVDAASSYREGVCVVVTGSLTASDNTKRKFVQSFFLAPQDPKGFFVLTDIFRFLAQKQLKDSDHVLEASEVAASEPVLVQEKQIDVSHLDSEISNHQEAVNLLEMGGSEAKAEVATDTVPACKDDTLTTATSVYEAAPKTITSTLPVQETAHEIVTETMTVHKDESAPVVSLSDKQVVNNGKRRKNTPNAVVQDNDPRKSYASIVRVVESSPPKKITAPTDNIKAKAVTSSSEKPVIDSKSSELKVSNDNSLDVEGYSVHVRNLPSNTTAEEVEEVFKKFGPIRPGGVQVRHKLDNFCFGFIEFESLSSMQAAIEASPVLFGGNRVYVDEKRTTTRVVNGVVINGDNRRGRGPQMRGNYYNDNFRRNDNFQGRNGNFNSHGRGRGGGVQGYYRDVNYQQQRSFQNGGRNVLAVNG